MFEHRSKPVIPGYQFFRRMSVWLGAAIILSALSLLGGMLGYHWLEGMGWVDSFVNAAMLLGGMGPVDDIRTEAGRVFAGLYAIYCGLFLIVVSGVLLLPVFHRVLHVFHAGDEGEIGTGPD